MATEARDIVMIEEEQELDLTLIKDALEIPEEEAFDPQRFVVDDDDKANWVLKKVANFENEAIRIEAAYRFERENLELWRVRELDRLTRPRSFFEGLIMRYVSRIREAAEAAGKKAASFRYSLPAGIVRIKDQAPEYRRDDEVLVAFFESHLKPDYVETVIVKKPLWGEYKKLLKTGELGIKDEKLVDMTTGVIVDGVEVIERPAKLEIEFEVGVK